MNDSFNEPTRMNNAVLSIKPQEYPQVSLIQSRAISKISYDQHLTEGNPQEVLTFFQTYACQNDTFDIQKLHNSEHLKMKKYKQSVYYGQFINGKRHGLGIMIYNNSRIYEGQWASDIKHGQGYEKFANNCIYKGHYVNGKPDGVGKYEWANGQFYEGQWKNGLKNGSGMWRGPKGDSYIGQWSFGKAHGYGVHTWINGDRYQGQFKDSLKHGEGLQRFANGDLYKGCYQNGKPSGYGEYFWHNGSYFKGTFKTGLRNGQGIWKRSQGPSDKYEGQYQNDRKCGYGIFTWSSGNVYKGNYKQDMRNGYGQMYWNDGSIYKGNWKDGIQHGEGQIFVPGQGRRKGFFENNVLVHVQQQQLAQTSLRTYMGNSNKNNKKSYEKISKLPPPTKKFEKNVVLTKNKINYQPNEKAYGKRNVQSMKRPNDRNVTSSIYYRSNKSRSPTTEDRISNNQRIVISDFGRKNNTPLNYRGKRNPPVSLIPNKFMIKARTPANEHYSEVPSSNMNNGNRNRILHSSFYLHQMHTRNSTTLTDTVSLNRPTATQQQSRFKKFGQDRDQISEEVRQFTRNKMKSLQGKNVVYY